MKNFNSLPLHSRVWIYQAERFFDESEMNIIKQKSTEFIDQWTSHGSQMDASIEVLHNCFVIVSVDEKTAPASGCGIDKSVRFMQSLEKELRISLMERTNVAYKDENGMLKSSSLKEFEKLINTGLISGNTKVFNNLITNKEELLSKWEVPLNQTWLARFQNTGVK